MTPPVTSPQELIAQGGPRAFWLDGGGSRHWSSTRSIVGVLADDDVSLTYDATRREVVRHRGGRSEVIGDDIFEVLGEHLVDEDPDAHWAGYFGYACRADLPASPATGVPDAVWMRASQVRFFEHLPVEGGAEDGRAPVVPLPPETPSTAAHREAFARVQEHLHAGNSYEVNLTYRERFRSAADPLDTYLWLRRINPAPYAAYLRHPGVHVLSSSPERFAMVTADRWLETKPIKGTTPRGATPAEDEALHDRLASDPKYRSENLMIVDLLRNDVARVCQVGSVHVPQLMEVESYPSVHQLVSTVRGRLRDDVSTIEALRSLFPAGSMTGAPKLRTMSIIDEVEATPRGVYAGAVGWIAGDGRADLGVVIRTVVTDGRGAWELGTGGGITVRSDVEEEWAETRWKAARVRAAVRDRA